MTPPDIKRPDVNGIDVIAPNFKRRLSGVTATVVRLVPLVLQFLRVDLLF